MHRVHEAEAFLDLALPNQPLDCGRDIHETATVGYFEPEMFGEALHAVGYANNRGYRQQCSWLRIGCGGHSWGPHYFNNSGQRNASKLCK